MSTALAIAGVTAVLKDLLNNGLIDHDVSASLGDVKVTALPPDRIPTGDQESSQLNLFLYQATANQGWRNVGMPSRDSGGNYISNPPLALDLHYLLSAYGAQEMHAEILLGYGMQLLHETPVLARDAIRTSLAPPSPVGGGGGLPPQLQALSTSELADQYEQIKICPDYMSTEEISKLWAAISAHYRPTAAFQVSVVLIETKYPARSALPVLTIGPKDSGVVAQPDLAPPFPTLVSANPPNQQLSVRQGEVLTLDGFHLDGSSGDTVVVILTHPLFPALPNQTPLGGATPAQVQVTIPNDPVNFPAGQYTVMVGFEKNGVVYRTTNELPFALAPANPVVTPNPATRDIFGNANLTVTCSPQVWQRQRVSLLLGDIESFAEPFVGDTTGTLNFLFAGIAPGAYLVRLRVDGIESILIDRTKTPPVFDTSQTVTIQ